MKLSLILFLFIALNANASTSVFTFSKPSPVGVEVKSDTITTRDSKDGDFQINGFNQYDSLEIGTKIPGDLTLKSLTAYNYDNRSTTSIKKDNIIKSETLVNNIESTGLSLDKKIKVGNFDLKPQVRALYMTDNEKRESFGTNGEIQERLYIGAPITNNLSLDKHGTYLRHQSFFSNEGAKGQATAFTNKITAKVALAYALTEAQTLGFGLNYNKSWKKNEIQAQSYLVVPTYRFAFDHGISLMARAEYTVMQSNDQRLFNQKVLSYGNYGLELVVSVF
jgi:hypothetical protein